MVINMNYQQLQFLLTFLAKNKFIFPSDLDNFLLSDKESGVISNFPFGPGYPEASY